MLVGSEKIVGSAEDPQPRAQQKSSQNVGKVGKVGNKYQKQCNLHGLRELFPAVPFFFVKKKAEKVEKIRKSL